MSDDLTDLKTECLKWAAVASEVFEALRALNLPEELCITLTAAWLTGSEYE